MSRNHRHPWTPLTKATVGKSRALSRERGKEKEGDRKHSGWMSLLLCQPHVSSEQLQRKQGRGDPSVKMAKMAVGEGEGHVGRGRGANKETPVETP